MAIRIPVQTLATRYALPFEYALPIVVVGDDAHIVLCAGTADIARIFKYLPLHAIEETTVIRVPLQTVNAKTKCEEIIILDACLQGNSRL